MATAIETIMANLNEVFVEMDAKVLEKTQEWAKERQEALREFQKSDEYQTLRRNQFALYERMWNICGGKGWFQEMNYCRPADLEKVVIKNCKRVADSRNASIANKLTKAEVTEVIDTTYNRTSDGFNGTFVVNTNKGRKVCTIDTIYAGGYNIQCLHLRILVKVK